MTKIATITCHDVYNYGASLQAFALQFFCKKSGFEYEIINYKPQYLSNHFKLNIVSNSKYNKPILKQLYLLAKLPKRIYDFKIKYKKRKVRFDYFTKKFLNITPVKYHNISELKNNPPTADIYIAGSDQIWNTLFQNGRDPAFYLDFGSKKIKRISYAASFSTDKIYNEASEFVKKMLKNFNEISVRERSSIELLSKLGILSAHPVLDPVFLLDKKEWNELLYRNIKDLNIKEDYILIYDFDNSELIREIAIKLKDIYSLPIYSISPNSIKYSNKQFYNAGPWEFLHLIKNAKFIISNSFHATAFSIIFEKNFFVINRKESINTRMNDLLTSINLENQIISKVYDFKNIEIEYKKIKTKLDDSIINSKNYLISQLNN